MAKVARKPLTTVISEVVEALKDMEGSVVTVADLSRRVNASWESVLKALKVIEEVQSLWDSGLALDMFKEGRSYKVVVRRRFSGMPLREIAERVRNMYFVEPDEMDVLLVNLLKLRAVNPSSAIALRRGPALERALELGYVAEANGSYYLTELGVNAAEVTLEMYPELADSSL